MEGVRRGRERISRTVSYPKSRRGGSGNFFPLQRLAVCYSGHERQVRSPRRSVSLVGAGELSRVLTLERWGSKSHQAEDINVILKVSS